MIRNSLSAFCCGATGLDQFLLEQLSSRNAFLQARMFPRGMEADCGPHVGGDVELGAHGGEESRRARGVVRHAMGVSVEEALERRGIVARHPTCGDVGRGS